MKEEEMKNFDLVEALMKRASGNETREEVEKLDQLIISGAISDEDMEKANNEVVSIRSLLPLIDEDSEAKLPEYAKERLLTKVKEVFPNNSAQDKSDSSTGSFLSFLKPILTLSIVIAVGYFIYTSPPKSPQNFASLASDKFETEIAIFDLDNLNSESSETRSTGFGSNQNFKLVTDPDFNSNTKKILEVFDNNKKLLITDESTLNNWFSFKTEKIIDSTAPNINKPKVKILYDAINLKVEVRIHSNEKLIKENSFLIEGDIDSIIVNIKRFIEVNLK